MATVRNRIQATDKFEPTSMRMTGHLHQGHNIIAASASIPSKYQTIVISKEENKGFNSASKRFEIQDQFNDSPGPAKYSLAKSIIKDNHESHSKKGLGGFVSKVKRFPRPLNRERFSVGPGQYNPCININHDFNKAQCTRNFHKPIAVKNNATKFQTPAPNQYNIGAEEASGNMQAAFTSKVKRDFLGGINSSAPAPGSYNFADEWITKTNGSQVPFKSTSQRTMLPSKSILQHPGPTTYSPYEKILLPERTQLHRKHYLCLSAPAIPMPPEPDAPGPGQYDLVNYEGPPKEYASSSMFASTTNRMYTRRRNTLPGPGAYDPRHHNKVSFICNTNNKWI